jgi:opacity protein-like surface antigen
MKRHSALVLAAAFIVLFTATAARAETTLTPFIGSLFKGDLPDAKRDYGASLSFMGAGIFGGEIWGNYAPSFDPNAKQAGLMGNLVIGVPIGGDSGASVKPYVTAGIGLFRIKAKIAEFDDRITSNDFAYNLGGGVMAFFNDHVGLRADLRFVRTLRDDKGDDQFLKPGDLNFWRWNIGPSFRF